MLVGTKWAANMWVWNSQRFQTGGMANPDGEGAPHIRNPNLADKAAASKSATKDESLTKVSAQFVNGMDHALLPLTGVIVRVLFVGSGG